MEIGIDMLEIGPLFPIHSSKSGIHLSHIINNFWIIHDQGVIEMYLKLN